MPRTVVGIDVGGTFTDIAVLKDGRLTVHKLPSTPQNPSLGILQGVREVNIDGADADFVHGSTVATNALLEGKGARTALVTTMGFEDVLEIGRQSRARTVQPGTGPHSHACALGTAFRAVGAH